MPHDATASWSGYQYQGKVAIYHVLKLFNKYNNDELINYTLEIEWLEDFSILKDGEYISAHQVKALPSKPFTINTYLDAMYTIYTNESECDNYLHVINEIKKWSLDSLNETLNNKIENLNKIIEDTEEKETNKSKARIGKEKILLIKENAEQFFLKTKLYLYSPGKSYCELDSIEILIKEELRTLYSELDLQFFLDDNSIEIVYLNCLGFIDNHVKDRHIENEVTTLNLSEIFGLITNKKILERGENFHIFNLKEKLISREKEDYCEGCSQSEKTCETCNLFLWIKSLKNLDNITLKKILKLINPNIKIDYFREENNDLLIKNMPTFFTILDEIKKEIILKGYTTCFEDIETYFPTTLRLNNPNRKKLESEKIKKKIEENSEFLSLIQESGVFITENIEGSIMFGDELNDDEKKDKYIFLEEISLSTLEQVKEKINI